MFLLNGLEIYLEGDSIPYPTQIVQAMSIPGDDPTFISFDGENPILEENGIFVSDFVVSFFETTNDEIVGKKLIAKSVSSSFMSAANKNMIDKCDIYLPSTTFTGMKAYKSFNDLPNRRGYGIVILKNKIKIKDLLIKHNWEKTSFPSTNSALNLRTSIIEDVIINAGFYDKNICKFQTLF